MKNWRVLSLYDISHIPDALDPLADVADVVHLAPTEDNLRNELPACDAYLAALSVRLTREIIEQSPRLRIVCTSSTGTDHLDMDALAERDIEVISLKYDTEFLDRITCTAEMAWCLLLAVVRKLPWSFAAAQQGSWARDRFRGHQLSEKTIGILGYGRLGRIMGRIARGFSMRVLAHDQQDVEPEEGVEMVDLDTLLTTSDVLSVHIHLTPENAGFLGRDAFAKLKAGAYLVNTSRGAIVDEAAMLEALRSGRLAGAGVDVIHGEWDENLEQHPLIAYAREHDNLVISPHTGGVTYEAQGMTMRHSAQKLARALQAL